MKDLAKDYCKDILNGKIPSCNWIKQACQRHLTDLKVSKNKDSLYFYDINSTIKYFTFLQLFRHSKGRLAGTVFKPLPWQNFIICSMLGWKEKKKKFGFNLRRFRKFYIKVPRKNGKSLFAASLAMYFCAFDEEAGSEVYIGALHSKQADTVFSQGQCRAPQR